MLRNTFLLLVTITLTASASLGQITKTKNNNAWFTAIANYNLSEKWFINSEVHIRRTRGLQQWQQFLVRPAINYRLNTTATLSVGYTYIRSSPYGKNPSTILIPEHNLWEQLNLTHTAGRSKFDHRFRLEHRFIGKPVFQNNAYEIEGNKYVQRMRYRFTNTMKFSGNGKWFSAIFDEIWISLADNLMPLNMNQNWIYIGLGYTYSSKGNLQIGYLHQALRIREAVYESNPTLQATWIFTIH